jgi:hypothetical protein
MEWFMQKHPNLDHDQQLAFQIGTAAYVLTYFEEWFMQKHLNLDHDQQLAFQIGTAAYVLTYFEDALEVETSFLRKEF